MEDIKRISLYKDPSEVVVIFDERKLVLDRREWDAGCIFLEDKCCTIQEKKPLICQLYPVCLSDKPLMEEGEPVRLRNDMEAYLYVDASCKGVGKGELLDVEEILEKSVQLRNEMLATDLGALIGWYCEHEDSEE